MAYFNGSVNYVGSVEYAAVATWHTPWSPVTGTLCRQATTPTAGNERVFVAAPATSGNAVGGTEPAWSTVAVTRTKIVDNLVTWWDIISVPIFNGDLANTLTWTQNKAYFPSGGLGYVITNNAKTNVFIQTVVSGAYGGSEPSWSVGSLSATTSDGSNVWLYLGPVSSFTTQWGAPAARLGYVHGQLPGGQTNTVYISDDHAETQASAMTLSPSNAFPTFNYCMDHTATFPLTATNLKTTASITTTGAFAITLNYPMYFYGVKFYSASGASATSMNISPGSNWTSYFDACAINLPQTGGKSLTFGTAGAGKVVMNNTTIAFGSTGDGLDTHGANVIWRNSTGYGFTGSFLPATPFNTYINAGATTLIDSVDLSNLSASSSLVQGAGQGYVTIQNCKLVSGWQIGAMSSGAEVNVFNSDSAANIYSSARITERGTQYSDINTTRSNGATDGTTAISWRLTSLTGANWLLPFDTLPMGIWNSTVGSAVAVTLYGLNYNTSLPLSSYLWGEVSGMATSGSTLGTTSYTGVTNPMAVASAYSADTSTWNATARLNSTAYVVGNTISVASNVGRVFYCTNAGTSSGSLPGAYATATDGSTAFTDGTAQFQALMRFSMTATFTPQVIGDVYVTVKLARANWTYWLDPMIVLH